MATPSTPKLISPITTITTATTTTTTTTTNDAVSPTKRPQPIPWTHQETVNLIRAYQEKWYSLKRGPLRSNQWEEVAVVVAARCGYDFNHPSKSAVQCRHKMEKLRQRHRAEKHRLTGGTPVRSWQYRGLMDELERGPMPISARPLASLVLNDNGHEYDEEQDEDEDEDDDGDIDESKNYVKSRSINYIISQRPQTKRVSKEFWRVNYDDDDEDVDVDGDNGDDDDEEEEEEVEEERVVVNERGLVLGLTNEIKSFAEKFIGMENLKMEMMKETERCRLEMENKRIEMIIESRRRIVDSIGRAFGSSKRMKINHEI